MTQLTKKSALAIFAMIGFFNHSTAQIDPRQVLAGMIIQVQTGTPNAQWYGPELWQTIALQTGNTGIYPQLTQLGPVQAISVHQKLQLPQGWLYSMTAQHPNGLSNWVFGINSYTNRIEYANFSIGAHAFTPRLPRATPKTEPASPDDNDIPASSTEPADSEACKKFPNLC